MAWVTLDDAFPDHRKIAGLSDAAFRLHVAGICHAARHLTDGLIEAAEVPRLVRRYRRQALAELVSRGLWTGVGTAESPAAYAIHDYLDWQDTRERVLARKAAAAAKKRRQRRGGDT